jgi:hypothetical protein
MGLRHALTKSFRNRDYLPIFTGVTGDYPEGVIGREEK